MTASQHSVTASALMRSYPKRKCWELPQSLGRKTSVLGVDETLLVEWRCGSRMSSPYTESNGPVWVRRLRLREHIGSCDQ